MQHVSNGLSARISTFSLLCAGMVVGIHVSGIESPGAAMWWWIRIGHYGIFLIAVPFFFTSSGFFIAGHFNEDGWWHREILKRVKSLLLPFLVWSSVAVLLAVGMAFCANLLHGRELFANVPSDWRWWSRAFGFYPFAYPGVVPLWYIRTLMIFVVVSPLLYRMVRWCGAKSLIIVYLTCAAVVLFADGRFQLFMRYTFQISFIVGFGGSLILTMVLRKMVPKFANIAFGGR